MSVHRLPHTELDTARAALQIDDRRATTRLDIAITESILGELGTSSPTARELQRLAEARRHWLLCAAFERETNHGGLQYYFESADGDFASQTVDSLNFFGATELAAILRSAVEAIPSKVLSATCDARSDWLDERGDGLFDELDDSFFAIATSEIERLKYAIENPDQFFDNG